MTRSLSLPIGASITAICAVAQVQTAIFRSTARCRGDQTQRRCKCNRNVGIAPGGPSWMNTDNYGIDAKASENVRMDAARPLFQKLLEDRFKLATLHETREVTTHELVPDESGQKIAPAKEGSCVKAIPENFPKPGEPLPRFCGNTSVRPDMIEAYGVPMERFVATLSSALGRNVIDKTGIKESVDVHLEFTPDELNSAAPPAADSAGTSIFVAIREQLG